MGPLKVLPRTLASERFCRGIGEDLATHGVARPAGELDSGPVDRRVWLTAVCWQGDARTVAPHTGRIAASLARVSCFGAAQQMF